MMSNKITMSETMPTCPVMPTYITKYTLVVLMALIMTGCQHIQLVRSPLPVTLADVVQDEPAGITYQQSVPNTIPVKNRPPKLTPKQQVQQVYLLENWF